MEAEVLPDAFDTSLATCSGIGGGVLAVAWEPKAGDKIATTSSDGSIQLFDNSGTSTGRLSDKQDHGFTSCLSWAPDADRLAVGCQDGKVLVFRSDGEILSQGAGHLNQVRCVSWCPSGTDCVASGSLDGTVRIWEPSKGKCLVTCQGEGGYVYCILWKPDGSAIAVGSTDGITRIFHSKTGACMVLCESHAGPVTSLAWGPGEAYLASGSHDGCALVWNARTGLKVSSCSTSSRVYSVAWRTDSHRPRLATASHDGLASIFDASLGVCMAKCEGHAGAVYVVTWSETSSERSWLASAGQDGTIRIWEATGQCLAVHLGHAGCIVSLCWSPDGNRLASGSEDGLAKIWPVTES